MDELDRNIVGLLGADARMSIATLARRLKVARSTIQARLERLETSGVIVGYTIKLGEQAREGHTGDQQAKPAERRLHQRSHDDAQRHASDRLTG